MFGVLKSGKFWHSFSVEYDGGEQGTNKRMQI